MSEKGDAVDIDKLGQLAYSGNISAVAEALATNPQLAHCPDKSGRTMLHWSAAGGHIDLVKLLLNNFSACPDVRDEIGWTPLIIASSAGRDEIVSYLLEGSSGVDINAVNSTGQCALHYAASKDRFEIAEKLLVKGAKPDIADHLSSTPLHRAASKGNTKLLKLLLSYRADPSARDSTGSTPLHLACEEDHEQEVRLLLSNGADATLTNKEEQTAYDVASKSLKQLLRNLGAVERS